MLPPKCSETEIRKEIEMLSRNAGLLLITAAALFWLSWLLVPGVGVTDAAQIFELVARKRWSVMLSVVTQLLSSALYIPIGWLRLR